MKSVRCASRRIHGRPLLGLGLVVLLAACLAAPAAAEPPADPPATVPAVGMTEAMTDLTRLEDALKNKKALNDEINQYLDLVASHFANIARPAAPEAPAEGADEAATAAHAEAVAQYEKDVQKFERDLDAFRGRARRAILKAFRLTDVRRETNQRDEVNRRAAQAYGALGKAWPGHEEEALDEREDLAKDLRGAIEALHKAKYDLSPDVLEEAFGALGTLDTRQSLEWMLKDYSHAKNNEAQWLLAAHKSMVKFTNVPGKLRYAIVEQFIRTYAGVESAAEKSSSDPKDQAKKLFWDGIKTATIPVVQYYAGNPTNTENVALASMGEFEEWFRDHKSERKPPWADEAD